MTAEADRYLPATDGEYKPRLRGVEVCPHTDPHSESEEATLIVRDPSGLSEVTLSMSLPALHVLSLMDGAHSLLSIQADFARRFGQTLNSETLEGLVQNLEKNYFLEGAIFEAHYDALVKEYLDAPSRRIRDLASLGSDALGLSRGLEAMFPWRKNGSPSARITGLIAPHLDYGRGQPCYLGAYSTIASQQDIDRFVILGTNHFGRSSSVVATSRPFESALGVTPVDAAFLEKLERRCGGSLRRYEFDHQREHSVELQVLLLQHLFGPESFAIVPLLCPSPCGPTGTAPFDGCGVDLKEFGRELFELLKENDARTCVIAGADLSHVGSFFGDSCTLTQTFLAEVGQRDQTALQHVAANSADEFVAHIARDDNPTRVCSAGCIYALLTALPDSKVRVLQYHQAVNDELQCCVTCAAAVLEAV